MSATTPPHTDPFSWNHSLQGDYLWSNTNFGEAVTEVMTPLTWGVIQFTLGDWVYVPGYATVGNIGGYPYINISVLRTALQALGKDRQDLLDTMEGTLYMQIPDEMEIPGVPYPRRAFFSLIQQLARVQLRLRQGEKRLPVYLAENPAWFQQAEGKIRREQTSTRLLALWNAEIRPHIKQGVWTVLGASMSSERYTARLRKKLTALAGSEMANLLIANLDSPTGLLPSLGLVVGLNQVANGEMTRADYLQHYGHRGPHEFELSHSRPSEDPGWLDAQIALLRTSPINTRGLQMQQKAALEQARESIRSRFPGAAKSMQGQLEESARRAILREHARSEYVRDRWLIRLFALQAGALSGLGDDIFFLTLEEVLCLLAGDQSACHHITGRKELYQRYKSLPPYPSIIRGSFDPFAWAESAGSSSNIFIGKPGASSLHSHSNILRGAPGSAGQVEGSVRVLLDPDEGSRLQPGEILVAVQTDITWTLLFPRAAAVVTDVGAPLSHAAIVARELGIPAVVGCGDATKRLKTSDRVRVDGSRGVIEILEHGNLSA